MKIQTTHRFTFQYNGAEFTTAGGNTVEIAPDWIVNDDYFRAAGASGRLVQLEGPAKVGEDESQPPLVDETNFPVEAQSQKLGLTAGENLGEEQVAEQVTPASGLQTDPPVETTFEPAQNDVSLTDAELEEATKPEEGEDDKPKRGRKHKDGEAE